MELEQILGAVAAVIHANLSLVSVASALVIVGLVLGDVEDLMLFALVNGWRKLLSLNVLFEILAEDAANATAAGAAAIGFFAALGAGASMRDAAIAAIVAIGTVNTGYLLGADRLKLQEIIGLLFKRKPVAPPPLPPSPVNTSPG